MVTGATREQLDKIINEHFMFEATDNLDGVMASLADDVRHEIIPSQFGEQSDKAGIRAFYADLFKNFRGERVEPLSRYYGDDFVIDETMWHGHVEDGAPLLCDGMSGPVSFRLLHVFEVKDGKITRGRPGSILPPSSSSWASGSLLWVGATGCVRLGAHPVFFRVSHATSVRGCPRSRSHCA